jgi:hypothetical protein
LLLVLALVLAGLTIAGTQPQQQDALARFCFAEWCVKPVGLSLAAGETVVTVEVSSTAGAVTQRPDHPQAWLSDADGKTSGGPQPDLNRAIGPQGSYSAALSFALGSAGCADFTVAEGAWPAILGLGYAPSPFTERARWRLCP